MALKEQSGTTALAPIAEEAARATGRRRLKRGTAAEGKGGLRVAVEHDVRRVIQVYWTPFEVNVPGRSLALHLEVAEPVVHWTECYLSPWFTSWVMCFRERADGELELAHYGSYETPSEAIEAFFSLSTWYVLTPTDLTWENIVYEVSDEVEWPRGVAEAGASLDAAISEALKKSTIVWLRWKVDGKEHTMPVWFVYDAKVDKLYVLSGERQQTLPGAEDMTECEVIIRWKGKNAQVAEIPATVQVLDRNSPEWKDVAEKVADKRLNIPGIPEDTAQRWRDECVILELTLGG